VPPPFAKALFIIFDLRGSRRKNTSAAQPSTITPPTRRKSRHVSLDLKLPATPAAGVEALEARLAADLSRLELPAREWVVGKRQQGNEILDIAGLAVAAALKFLGMRARIFDRSPRGLEGPWATTARMETYALQNI
jgi:hypothetical protein